MTFLEHLNTLRRHIWFSIFIIIIGSIISIYFYDFIIEFLSKPILSALDSNGRELYMNTIYEGFFAKIKISLLSGIILTLPLNIINFIVFIFPALTARERRVASAVIITGFILIIISIFYGYNYVIPITINFLTGGSVLVENSSFLLGFTKNIFYILQFIGAMVVIFQVPLLLLLLISMKVVTVKTAIKYGRHIVVVSFLLSAMLTPPDAVSQLMTALPLVLLYYLALLVAKIFKIGEEKCME